MIASARTGSFIRLDAVIGWQAVTDQLSPVSPAGLAVDCVTGQPRAFVPQLVDQLRYPIALARGDCDRRLYVLDGGVSRVKLLDLEQQKTFVTIEGFGGTGRQARRLRNPRGLAVLDDGSLAIADTGNHQLKIFSRFPHALLSVWGSGSPGRSPRELDSPRSVVADRCGLVHISDTGNGRIQRIRRDGSAEPPIEGLRKPTALALGGDGTLVVLDSPNVCIYGPGQTARAEDFVVPTASCVAVDDSGSLYVGTTTGLVYKFEATGVAAFRSVGIGVTGMDAAFLDLIWTPEAQLIAILIARCATQPVLATIPVCGSYLPSGTLTTLTIDSGIENCVWDCVRLNASIPSGALIEVATQTARTDAWAGGAQFQPECSACSTDATDCRVALAGDSRDCLVQSLPGRYLRMQLRFKTSGIASPVLRGVEIDFPRASYLQYLPAVYQEDDPSRIFLDRFLRIFQSTFDGMDRAIDDLWMMFDPLSVPDAWFSWLAAWIALPINPSWSELERRAALKSAGRVYRLRGTAAGVQQLVKQYSGIDVRLIEHFRLRQLMILPDKPPPDGASGVGTRLWSWDHYQRLQLGTYSRVGYFQLAGEPEPDIEPLAWGANEFTVFFDCDPYRVADTMNKVSQVVEREKPAYTKANYAPVFPRMRVGVQSTLGVDTRVGEITPLLLGITGTLDYDSILAGPRMETYLPAGECSLRPQVEVSTRLL